MENHKKVKKILAGRAAMMFLVICYFLFETVISWAAGWQALPEAHTISPGEAIFHAQLQAPAVSIVIGARNKIVLAEARAIVTLKMKSLQIYKQFSELELFLSTIRQLASNMSSLYKSHYLEFSNIFIQHHKSTKFVTIKRS